MNFPLYPTSVKESLRRLTKFICGFRKCHSVCSNIWEVSFVTTLLTRKCFGWIHLWLNFLFSFIGEKIKKGLGRCMRFLFKAWQTRNSLITAHDIFNRARDDSKGYAVTKEFFARENWYYLKYNCYRPWIQECGIARMNLSSGTNSIKEKHLTFVYNCVWNVSFT